MYNAFPFEIEYFSKINCDQRQLYDCSSALEMFPNFLIELIFRFRLPLNSVTCSVPFPFHVRTWNRHGLQGSIWRQWTVNKLCWLCQACDDAWTKVKIKIIIWSPVYERSAVNLYEAVSPVLHHLVYYFILIYILYIILW